MIVTVTLNAAIDKALSVPNFQLGRRHRTVEQHTTAGGKGVNIARTLKTLGAPVVATGLVGGPTGSQIVELLTQESILSDFVRIEGESRTNLSVLDPTTGEETEINQRGPTVSEDELARFSEKLLYLARGSSIVVFAGSVAPGIEPGFYGEMIPALHKLDVLTVVDCDGDSLRHAVRAEPGVVSPNMLEAEELVGHEFNDDEDRCQAVAEIVALGAREAIMTVPDGCFAQTLQDGVPALHRVAIEQRQHGSTVGSGDAFLAGYVAARYRGDSAEDCLRFGVACGAESTRRLGAGLVDPREVAALIDGVKSERLATPAAV